MERYRGDWQGDSPHGVGEHTYFAGLRPSKHMPAFVIRCNRYIGMMNVGKRHGEGCMLYGSGTSHSIFCGSVIVDNFQAVQPDRWQSEASTLPVAEL